MTVEDRTATDASTAEASLSIVELASAEPSRTAAGYARLLGMEGVGTAGLRDGTTDQTPLITTPNASIRARRGKPGEHRILFTSADPHTHLRLLRRRGLTLSGPHDGVWDAERLPVGVAATSNPTDITDAPGAPDILGIDHLVFQGQDRDRCVALFGSTLGLDFRLDRQAGPELRQLFFRAGDLVVEVVIPAIGDPSDPDPDAVRLWGIAWRSSDISTTRKRLLHTDVEVSEIRQGRKPGTQVATVTDDDLATRTLIIGHS